jgi:hypothetical protein
MKKLYTHTQLSHIKKGVFCFACSIFYFLGLQPLLLKFIQIRKPCFPSNDKALKCVTKNEIVIVTSARQPKMS